MLNLNTGVKKERMKQRNRNEEKHGKRMFACRILFKSRKPRQIDLIVTRLGHKKNVGKKLR